MKNPKVVREVTPNYATGEAEVKESGYEVNKKKLSKKISGISKSLSKRLKKPKRILRSQQLQVNINPRNAPYIPTFMSNTIQEEKRSMFFS
jgi:hypothetical protein